jgi:hypothetical protein
MDSTGSAVRTSNPALDRYDSDNFSNPPNAPGTGDIYGIGRDAAIYGSGYKGYLGTPSGHFKVYDPSTGVIGVLK